MSAAFSAWAPIEAAWATKSISGCTSTFESLYMLLNSAPPHSCCSRLMQP